MFYLSSNNQFLSLKLSISKAKYLGRKKTVISNNNKEMYTYVYFRNVHL